VALAEPRQCRRTKSDRVAIYAVYDPRDNGVRYVGKTATSIESRLLYHLAQPTNTRMRLWFAALNNLGLRPKIVVLEWVSERGWDAAERGWIYWFTKAGHLLNADVGGRGRGSIPSASWYAGKRFKKAEAAPPIIEREARDETDLRDLARVPVFPSEEILSGSAKKEGPGATPPVEKAKRRATWQALFKPMPDFNGK
jgi:hypothetical protein